MTVVPLGEPMFSERMASGLLEPPEVTFPVSGIETLVAPVDERTRLPLRAPTEALETIRTLRVALALPEVWAMVAVESQVEPPLIEYSKPLTASMEMSALRLVPVTPRLWEAEELPAVVEKGVKVPLVEIAGALGSVTVKDWELVADSSPTVTVMGPLVAPAGTVAVRLEVLVTEILVDAVPLKETVVFPATKLFPVMVTDVPTWPVVGVMLVIVGAVGEEADAVT